MAISLVDKEYIDSIARMSGQERVARTSSLFDSIRQMLALQVRKEFPKLTERAIKVKVAERLYISDASAQSLLKLVKVD